MRGWMWRAALGMCLAFAGCAPQPALTVDQAAAELKTGGAVLKCGAECLPDWRRDQPQAQQLAAAGRWRDLAYLVERVGYGDDLAYFYLGRAAEGLGEYAAAASYYRQSAQLSGTAMWCGRESGQCGGVYLPHEALVRLAAVNKAIAPHRVSRPAASPAAATAAPAATEAQPEGEATPAVQLPPAAQNPAAQSPANATEYIEPPPASH